MSDDVRNVVAAILMLIIAISVITGVHSMLYPAERVKKDE